MKMKYMLIVLVGIVLYACNNDDTTYDTVEIPEINIDTTLLQKEYNRELNQTLTIDPQITQTGNELPLTYEWQVDYKLYSSDKQLIFPCEKLGSYVIRLKVSNTKGSSFYITTLHINSPYEEGITILSKNAAGESMLSFMRKYSDQELIEGKTEQFETGCLRTNNPDITFPKNPTDMVKREKQLFISYTDAPAIYAVNTKTFEVENIIRAPEYPTFIPLKMNIEDNNSRNALVMCENGNIYNFSTFEGVIIPAPNLSSSYALNTFIYTPYATNSYLWDETNSNILYAYPDGEPTTAEPETFAGHEFINFFMAVKSDYFTVITKDKQTQKIIKTSIGLNIWDVNYDDWPDIVKTYALKEQKELEGTTNLTPSTPLTGNSIYKELLYAIGNKIYRWYYTDNSFPTTPWATIDLEGAEITTLSLSRDEKQLYVGVYQPLNSGHNGHLYILDSDTGKPIGSPYPNVAYKPVKILYKVK